MKNLEAQMLFKRMKVAILVQQLVAIFDAERGDHAIDRAPNRDA